MSQEAKRYAAKGFGLTETHFPGHRSKHVLQLQIYGVLQMRLLSDWFTVSCMLCTSIHQSYLVIGKARTIMLIISNLKVTNSRQRKTCQTFPSPVIVPTKLMGHLSRRPIFVKMWASLESANKAFVSWYSAPQSSKMLRVGSPSWNSPVRITAPAGSHISFSTLPKTEQNLQRRLIIMKRTGLNLHQDKQRD